MTEKPNYIRAGDLTAKHLLLMVEVVGNVGGTATYTVGVLAGVFHNKEDTTVYLNLADGVDVDFEIDSDTVVQFGENTETVIRGAIYSIEND